MVQDQKISLPVCDSFPTKQVAAQELRNTSISEDTSTTQTPRSASRDDDVDSESVSALESPWSGDELPKSTSVEGVQEADVVQTQKDNHGVVSDEEEIDESDDEEEHRGQAEYYDFLREFAGSFEAASEDEEESESERDIDENASDDEESESSSPWSRSRRRGCRCPAPEDGDVEAVDCKSRLRPPPVDQNPGAEEIAVATPSSPSTLRGNPPEDIATDARIDRRGPVKDDYDVGKATQHYAMLHPGDWVRRQRETMQEAIRMREVQAKRLSGLARSPHLKSKLAGHYGRVSMELLREAQILEYKLSTFDKACEARRDQQAQVAMPCCQAVAVQ